AAHSVLAPAAVLAAATLLRSPRLAAFGAGWAGHILCDVPVHHTDARPHGYPLSARRLRSPVSFWDRRRHAGLVTAAELALGVTALASLTGRRPLRGKMADGAVFLRAFVTHPAQVGAVVPTSGHTVAKMLDLAGWDFDWRDAKVVVEVGAGTGVYTEQILERAGPQTEVLAFERDPV